MHSNFTIDDEGNWYWYERLIGHKAGLSIAAGDALNQYAQSEDSINIALAPEPSADIAFLARGATFGVERKALDDLVNSRFNGRLAEELRRMLTYYDHAWLAIEVEAFAPVPWTRDIYEQTYVDFSNVHRPFTLTSIPDDLQTMLLDWQELGVKIIYTADPQHTMEYVRKLAKKYRSRAPTEPFRQLKRPNVGGLAGLLWIPGIAGGRATQLLRQYGTLEKVYRHYLRLKEDQCKTAADKAVWRALHGN